MTDWENGLTFQDELTDEQLLQIDMLNYAQDSEHDASGDNLADGEETMSDSFEESSDLTDEQLLQLADQIDS